MRIAHVFKDYWPPLAAGITRYIADVADAAVERGHQVEVHTAGVRRSGRERMPSGVVVHRHREFGRVLSSPLSPGLVWHGRAVRADVLHVHAPNPVGELGALLAADQVRIVTTFHAQLGRQRFLSPVYGPLQRRVFGRSSVVVVASEAMAGAPDLAAFTSKVRVIPFGVSPHFVSSAGRPRAEKLGRLRVLFVGRLVYYKGIDVLLRAISLTSDVELSVVGEGALREELERLAGELGVASVVRFRGAISDEELHAAHLAHDVLVLPSTSRAEAFGLAVIEAMASGLPVVTTRLGTATDWVNLDGVSGMVVPPGDPVALARALEQMRPMDTRKRLGDGAQHRVADLFSFQRHCDSLFDVYEHQ